MTSRRKRNRRDKRAPIPDFDPPPQQNKPKEKQDGKQHST